MDTPASLLERLRYPVDGDWARFVELYTPLLFSWARRMGCQEQDAADLVQEVLTLLVRKLPDFKYDGQKSFRRWLHTVTVNRWRNTKRRAQLPRDGGAADLAEIPAADLGDPFWETEYRNQLVRRALDLMRAEFQPTTWKACWESVVDGLPAAEIAAELGMSVGAVYMAKSRVLSRLRQELAGLLE
jgi:RNA polymerase sigma-70 factor, ECF subfamily